VDAQDVLDGNVFKRNPLNSWSVVGDRRFQVGFLIDTSPPR